MPPNCPDHNRDYNRNNNGNATNNYVDNGNEHSNNYCDDHTVVNSDIVTVDHTNHIFVDDCFIDCNKYTYVNPVNDSDVDSDFQPNLNEFNNSNKYGHHITDHDGLVH